MEKQDVIVFAVAVVIVLLIALVGKPLLSGETISFYGIGDEGNADASVTIPEYALPTTAPPMTFASSPTPTPWDGTVQEVGYVDPETYDVSFNEPLRSTERPASFYTSHNMTDYAVIQGNTDGTTDIVYIPYPYWEIVVAINKTTEESVIPSIVIQIRNVDDPQNYEVFTSRLEATPSPWTIKNYSGAGNYYFIITSELLKAYKITIRVPEKAAVT